jgi:hypothetical protein
VPPVRSLKLRLLFFNVFSFPGLFLCIIVTVKTIDAREIAVLAKKHPGRLILFIGTLKNNLRKILTEIQAR